MSHEEFVWYHENKHYPLFRSLPGVRLYLRRYLRDHSPQETLAGISLSAFDGIAEIWFDDLESLYKLFEADAYQQIIRADQEKFMDLRESNITISNEIL